MNVQMGVDILNINRIKKSIEENSDYLTYVFSDEEIKLSEEHANSIYYYASLFSLKEAMFKSLNIFWQDEMDWKDFNVCSVPYSHPSVFLSGKTKQIIGLKRKLIFSASNSYDGEYVIGIVLCTEKD